MSPRREAFLDEAPGETRAVVTLDGAPERLIVVRASDPACQALGATVVGRIAKLAGDLAFVDLGEGAAGVLNLRPETARPREGHAVRVEVRAEAQGGKGASLRWLDEDEGPPRLVAPAPTLAWELARLAPGASIVAGAAARAMADAAQEEALQAVHRTPEGGSIAIERTRALVAIDVDLGAQIVSASVKRAAAQANLAAIRLAARLLRLKGEGGLVVIDLAGRGHNGPALIEAARTAFAPDNPGVAIGPVSRFGAIELAIPRRRRSLAERLLGSDGHPTAETLALRLLRAIEREALAAPGARIEARAAPAVARAAAPYLKRLEARFGARLALTPAPGPLEGEFEVSPR